MNPPELRIGLEQARTFWHRRQGLAATLDMPRQELIRRSGWLRTLGGIDAYLAVRARRPGVGRGEIDAAVAAGRLRVMPAVRGCIYLVPETDAALALRVAELQQRPRTLKELEKAGVGRDEVERLSRMVLELLQSGGPLTTDGIRKGLPPGAVRSLGEAGKKVGLSSPLPVALRELEFGGRIRRTLPHGRIDTEKYLWQVVEAPVGPRFPAEDTSGTFARLAEVFLRQAGPVSRDDFAAWSGLPKREAQAALAAAGAVRVSVEGYSGEAYLRPEDRAELAGSTRAAARSALLAFEDNYLVLHGGPALLTEPRHHVLPVENWSGGAADTLGTARHVSQRVILAGELVAGYWEYDPDMAGIIWRTFDPPSVELRRGLEALGAETARFISGELGHACSHSLDSEADLRRRASRIRALSGQ